MALLVGRNASTDTRVFSPYFRDELNAMCIPYVASASGIAAAAYIRIADTLGTSNYKVCVYDSSGNYLSTATFVNNATGWKKATLSPAITITSGQNYYFGVICDDGYVSVYTNDSDGGYNLQSVTSGSYATPPSSYAPAGDGNGGMNGSRFAIYLASAGGIPPWMLSRTRATQHIIVR